MNAVSDEILLRWTEFWDHCVQLISIYPNRPPTISGESEAKQIERRLKSLALELVPQLVANEHWLANASVGMGNWASVPWVSIFDSRESTSAQEGVYPVIHLSPENPVGIRMGLGVSATAFRSRENEKASQVWEQLSESQRADLRRVGFQDIVRGDEERTEIGVGSRARRYSKGMVFEQFVDLNELKANPNNLTHALQVLLAVYKDWVDLHSNPWQSKPVTDFIDLMRIYADQHVVFMSPKREAGYEIESATDSSCTVHRLDTDTTVSITRKSHDEKRDWLRSRTGKADRFELDTTVARQMVYLQSPEMALAADRKTVVLLEDPLIATQVFIELIRGMQTTTIYKPVILALVIEGIRSGELTQNHVEFDWLLPRFIARIKEHGNENTGEQQLAEGFARMANDLFWLHAYRDPIELVPLDRPTASLIRERISHARLHEAFWQIIQQPDRQQQVLDALAAKWWPMVNPPVSESLFKQAMEQLVDAIDAEGFIFHPWQIATYVTALRTKPFVILAGISGTGKSKLPELVARLTAGNCVRVSVRPDWTDSSEVLGYIDLNDRFRPGRVLQLAHDAEMDPDRYHVCLIDEMNLARVEHYFAEVLSAIEDRRPSADGGYQSTALVAQKLPADFSQWQEQTIPANLGIVGTVNMDESSHGFSRKVLDRAFTIELSEVDLSLDATHSGSDAPSLVEWSSEYWKCSASRMSEVDLSNPTNRQIAQKATSLLQEINRSLVHCQLQVGYRTRDEVIMFMIQAEEIGDLFRTRGGESVDPLDLAVMMKILPRLVGGSNAIRQTLMGFLGVAVEGKPFATEDSTASVVDNWVGTGRPDWIDDAQLPRSAARLCLMWKRLEDGYTSYWL